MINRSSFEVESFGQGGLVSCWRADNVPYVELPEVDKARVSGWYNGCPVVEELIMSRGAETMASRYNQINHAFLNIVETVNQVNPELADKLMSPVLRRAGEPVGPFETESVPKTYQTKMEPLGTLAGYVLPRLVIKEAEKSSAVSNADVVENLDRQASMNQSLVLLGNAARRAKEPEELLAIFAQDLAKLGHLSHVEVLQQILPYAWFKEHGAESVMASFRMQLLISAKGLWEDYVTMPEEEKTSLGLA